MKTLTITAIIVALFIASCNQKTPPHYKYEIQVGTAVFCIDYQTDFYYQIGNSIQFVDAATGKKIIVDNSKVLTIKQPGDEKPNY